MKAGAYKTTFDGLKKFKQAVEALSNTEVYVGIPSNENERKSKDEDEEPINNATIGYIQENGSDIANIPPRPHLVPGIKKASKDVSKELKKAGQLAFTNPGAVQKYYERAGIIASNSVKNIIQNQEGFQGLSEKTKKARKAKGAKGEKALIRTGQYRNAITYVVGDKK